MITFDGVTKRYADGTVAVDDLSLEVPTGAITVFVGPSGCGKTTSLRMINRMIDPTEGRILLDGKDVTGVDPATLRRGIGYVIQQAGLFPHRRIVDNVATVPLLLGWDKKKARDRAMELLERVGLDPKMARRYPFQLSGGQQQRVGVARALAADPPVLLMDEPFSAVDPIVRTSLQEELLRLQSELHKTIVFVTHDIDEAVKLGDTVAVLRVGGKLAQIAEPAALLSDPADDFVREFLGRDRGIRRLGFVPARNPDARTGARRRHPRGPRHLQPGDRLAAGRARRGAAVARRAGRGRRRRRAGARGGRPGRARGGGPWMSLSSAGTGSPATGTTAAPTSVKVLLENHIVMAFVPVIAGLLIAIPLGLACARYRWLYQPTVGIMNVVYSLPSLALFSILLSVTGLTQTTVIIPLTLFSLAVLIPAVVDGMRSVPDHVRQSAVAMGFQPYRRLLSVELPIAVPVVLAGLRVAAVSSISLVSVGALIGQGGLGYLFIDGWQRQFYTPIVVGIVLVVALALVADLVIIVAQRLLTPWSRRPERGQV